MTIQWSGTDSYHVSFQLQDEAECHGVSLQPQGQGKEERRGGEHVQTVRERQHDTECSRCHGNKLTT